MTPTRRFGWTAIALLALVGCDTSNTTPSNNPPLKPVETNPGKDGVKDDAKDKNDVKSMPVPEPKPGASAAKLTDEEIAEVKKLPADEQAGAMAQMVCPVSGAHLGKMGTPIKQVVDGKTFYLCCDNCEEDVKKDPAAVLAKLKK